VAFPRIQTYLLSKVKHFLLWIKTWLSCSLLDIHTCRLKLLNNQVGLEASLNKPSNFEDFMMLVLTETGNCYCGGFWCLFWRYLSTDCVVLGRRFEFFSWLNSEITLVQIRSCHFFITFIIISQVQEREWNACCFKPHQQLYNRRSMIMCGGDQGHSEL